MESTQESIQLLASLLTSLQTTLKRLHLSDCKITLNESEHDETNCNEIPWKRLMSSFKASKLIDLDLSYNQFSHKYFAGIIESLPDYQIESLNMSNSLVKRKIYRIADGSDDFIGSFTKFIGSNLVALSLRGLGLSTLQTSMLIE